jgi:hypothetical protein
MVGLIGSARIGDNDWFDVREGYGWLPWSRTPVRDVYA